MGQESNFEVLPRNMSIQNGLQILSKNDGSLPDIEFDFGLEKCVATAYQVIQNHASYINSLKPYYWSRLQGKHIKFLKRKSIQKVFFMPSGF
jgi:hypothetical protein